VEEARGRGIGANLLEAAIGHCRERGGRRLTTSTAIASFAALRFYLCRGFRLAGIARDAFSPARGYPANAQLDGVPLNDAVLLELSLQDPNPIEEVHE
jgi:ribosomal protein S18 acetylase RimI-like enzyme